MTCLSLCWWFVINEHDLLPRRLRTHEQKNMLKKNLYGYVYIMLYILLAYIWASV